MMSNKYIIILLLLFVFQNTNAQLGFCNGNSGDPIFTETFGTGTTNSTLPPPGITTYNYSNNFPNDGFYTVSNGTFGNGFDWHQTEDHTIGDVNGKCLLINAESMAGEFYSTTVSGLCESTTYEFSAWVLNLVIANSFCSTTPSGTTPIDVTFQITDLSGDEIISGNTGNITESSSPIWQQFGLVFQTNPGETSVILKMINTIDNGECGNDLAIDDIVFKSCGDTIIVQDENNNTSETICSSQAPYTTTLTAVSDGNVFDTHFYQWQESNDNTTWADIIGEINADITVIVNSTKYYRAKVAEFAANLNNSDCITFSDVFILTVTQEVTPTFNQVADICSGDTLAPLPTTSTEGVTGTWSPALDNTSTTNYTFSPNDGECAEDQSMTITVNQPVTPTFTQVADICNGDTLAPLPTTSTEGVTGTWSPALDNTSTTNYTFSPNDGECAEDQTMTITVNQPVTPTFNPISDICNGDTLAPLPTTSTEGITGTWSPALDNTSTTTYTFSPSAGECAEDQTMTITVNQPVTPTFTQVADICSGDPLAPLPTTSTEGITGAWSPALDNTSTTTYNFSPDNGQCAISSSMIITVNQEITPTFNQIPDICSGDDSVALPTTSNEGITGTWSPALDNTTTTTYTFSPSAGECASSNTMMTITVNSSTTSTFNQVSDICSGDALAPLPTTSNEGITGTWSPALDNTNTTTYTFSPNDGECAEDQSMTITVNQPVTPTFNPISDICRGDNITALPTTSNEGITGIWSPALNNTTTTTYTFTPNSGTGQCLANGSMTISVIVPPVIESVVSDGDTIIIETTTPGDFEYSIDGIQFQSSNIFNNLEGGLYTVSVKDRNNCGMDSREHLIFIIPKYFTPNGDTYNDYFEIKGLTYYKNYSVHIFNRFGKLLYGKTNERVAWDGTLNNKLLPTSDYWYIITIDGKKIAGHFSLIR